MFSTGALAVPLAVTSATVLLPTAIAGAAATERLPGIATLACALGCPHAPQNALSSAIAAPHFAQFAMFKLLSFRR